MQGNEIAALDPLQEADKVLTRSSKPVVLFTSSMSSMLVAVRVIRLMKIWLLTMMTLIVAVTKTRMTVEVLFMQHVFRRTA